MTPAEAIEKNSGKTNLQFKRAIQDLLVEIEEAIECYTGNPVYVGLPAYLQYKVQADNAAESGQITLKAVESAIYERFGPSRWTVAIVTNQSGSYYWAKLRDARHD